MADRHDRPGAKKAREAAGPYYDSRGQQATTSAQQASAAETMELNQRPSVDGLIEIKADILFKGEELGKGACATVYKGKYMLDDVAIKEFSDYYDPSFASEFRIQLMTTHSHVVKIIGAQTKQPPLRIVMELMGGNLRSVVLEDLGVELSLADRLRLMRQVCLGLCALHSKSPHIVHGDLKSLNVLVKKTGGPERFECKLSDFGLAKIMEATKTSMLARQPQQAAPTDSAPHGGAGSFPWMAPEVMGGQQATRSSDVYSFATVCWEILTRRAPHAGLTPQNIVSLIGRRGSEADAMLDDGRDRERFLPHALPPDCPEPLRRLLVRCWSVDRAARPTALEALDELTRLEAEATQHATALVAAHVDAYMGEHGGSEQNRDARLELRLCKLVKEYERSPRAAELLSAFAAEVQSRFSPDAIRVDEKLGREMRVVGMLPEICKLWARFLATQSFVGADGRAYWRRAALADITRAEFNFVSLGEPQFREILAIALPERREHVAQETYTEDEVREFCYWLHPVAITHRSLERLFVGGARVGDAFLTLEAAEQKITAEAADTYLLRLTKRKWPEEYAGAATATYKTNGQVLHRRIPPTLDSADAVRAYLLELPDLGKLPSYFQRRPDNYVTDARPHVPSLL
eukprot:tig00021017_g17206.t1